MISGLIELSVVATVSTGLLVPVQSGNINPFQHCRWATNDDAIKPLPRRYLAAAKKALDFGQVDEAVSDDSDFEGMIVYRCMDGRVLVCSFGANLPCNTQADLRTIRPDVSRYCRDNRNEDFVPRVVTGHATIYSWACRNGIAYITQASKIDGRGFSQDIWAELPQ